jgi:predicted XRE-type DNA-binding protein
MSQNLFALFESDPVKANVKNLKAAMFVLLISLIRDNKWTQAEAAEKLNISAPRMSNLFTGQLEKFSIDMLFSMLVVLGYNFDVELNVKNAKQAIVITAQERS